MTDNPTPDASPDFTILSLPYDGGVARVAVSQALLSRAPWFRGALAAVVYAAGKFWPDNIRLLDEEEWNASHRDIRLFVVSDWVFDPSPSAPEKPKRRPTWKRRLLGFAAKPLRHKSFNRYDPTAYGAYLLSDALYQQFKARGIALCDVFSRERFRDRAYSISFALHGGDHPGGCWFAFAVPWVLLVLLPLFLALHLYNAVSFVLLRLVLLVIPHNRYVRSRHARLRRRLRSLGRIPTNIRRGKQTLAKEHEALKTK